MSASFLAKVASDAWLRLAMAVGRGGTMKVGASLRRKKAKVV